MSRCDLSKFYERDINLFLAEELRVNPVFCQWFIHAGGGGFECRYPAREVKIGLHEDGSEADIAALFEDSAGHLFRLFVENKITAPKMPEQLERYIIRAENEKQRGMTVGWAIKLFSPRAWYGRHCPGGVQNITFEDAAQFLRKNSRDARALYRADLLSAAAVIRSQSEKDAHTAETEPFIKEFWDAVYERLEAGFPGYFVHKTQYPRSVYFAPETHGFPTKLLRVDFKGHKGEVDLAFKNVSMDRLRQVLEGLPDVPGALVANKGSSALRISGLPKFTIADGPGIINDRVLPCYRAAHKLMEFWKKHEKQLSKAFDNP